jgi:hypothetical protein
MTASEPGRDRGAQPDHRAALPIAPKPVRAPGARPIVWRWWVLAALLSLALWAGLAALAL